MRPLVLLFACLMASCSFLPNSVVRVALPSDPEVAAEWAGVAALLASQPGPVTVELVAPDAFPPPDLVWFEGDFEDPAYLSQALASNAEVANLGIEAGLSPAWFGLAGDRLYPVAWNPWAWWQVAEGSRAPAPDEDDARALAAFLQSSQGPELGSGTMPQTAPPGRRWLSAARVGASPDRTHLSLVSSEVVVARVKGFWWNAQGWNPQRVPDFLRRLWSPEVQALWTSHPQWLPASKTPFPAVRTIVTLP